MSKSKSIRRKWAIEARQFSQCYLQMDKSISIVNVIGKTPTIESKLEHKIDITFHCKDTIDCGRELQLDGFNPVCLNMASHFKPGGGYMNGALAQEESLFYRTTYCVSLENTPHVYPLFDQVLYSPNVYVWKDSSYKKMKGRSRFYMSFIACSAIRKPCLYNGMLTESDYGCTLRRIERLLAVAIHRGHDSIVLGAFGTGAYGNPCEDVAEAFRVVLMEQGMAKYFKKIIFAILPARRNNPLEIFKAIIL